MKKGAQLSNDGLYRYKLWRIWDEKKPVVLFIMLNPSTADADNDDPTIRKCMKFAKRWGFGGLLVVNLFAFRATDPAQLVVHSIQKHCLPEYLIGPGNNIVILDMCKVASMVVCAWGNYGTIFDRSHYLVARLEAEGIELHALDITKKGEPGHPLYLKDDSEPFKVELV